jgi:hypothetical protein
MAEDLWSTSDPQAWQAILEQYPSVVAVQGVTRLPALDRWYHEELPAEIAPRHPTYVTLDELIRTTEWKMARGVWRQRNLLLVRSNPPAVVAKASGAALAAAPDPLKPIRLLAELHGVGPATASAIAAAFAPAVYPFFDELVANQIPGLGSVDFTLRYYARYAEALRQRAAQLGGDWTPAHAERALWANAGGKAGRY